MKYDFTTIMDRKGKDSIAVDNIPIPGVTVREGFSRIPMWVADMNFPTVPTIVEEVIKRAQHPAFGYFSPSDDYFDSIIRWQKVRHGVEGLSKEDIGYENGVLGCVASALRAFTAPGEAILLHSPTYIGFTGTVNNAGRKIVHSELVPGRTGRLADGLRGYGPEAEGKPYPLCDLLLPPQPHRPGLGAMRRSKRPWKSTAKTTASSSRTKSGAT